MVVVSSDILHLATDLLLTFSLPESNDQSSVAWGVTRIIPTQAAPGDSEGDSPSDLVQRTKEVHYIFFHYVLLYEPDTMHSPPGENAMDQIKWLCPSIFVTLVPIVASQICTVLSLKQDTMRMLSGKNATEWIQSLCPSIFVSSAPIVTSCWQSCVLDGSTAHQAHNCDATTY